jgi:hypothetical protein
LRSAAEKGLLTLFSRSPRYAAVNKNFDLRPVKVQLRDLPSRLRVQQPCSNPDEYSENSGKVLHGQYAYLQGFCKLWKPPAKLCASLIRKRSLVRVQAGPLAKVRNLQAKRDPKNEAGVYLSLVLSPLFFMESGPTVTSYSGLQ